MSANLREQLAVLPDYLGSHLVITVIPLLLALAISLPAGILLARRRRWRDPVLTLVGVAQTVPGLALLALMVPVLVVLGQWLRALAGLDLPALGWPPALLALTLYALLPMLRNTVTGLLGIDPSLKEAARALGMTPGQSLRQVELPLALPVIVAGVRTATVWTVGTATLATPVGQTCLGNYIFMGLQTRNTLAVLFGCFAAAGLAIVLDGLIAVVERGLRNGRRRLTVAAGVSLFLLVAAGLAAPWLARPGTAAGDRPWVVGAKTFTEQYILAEVMAASLRDAGLPVATRTGLGSTVVLDALVSGEVDVYVDYSGTLWANAMGREGSGSPEEVRRQVGRWLQERHGVTSLGALGFENAYALAMPRDRARDEGLETVGDLAERSTGMTIGGDYEFFGRPEWRELKTAYGLAFRDTRSFDSSFMYQAVARGEVDVIAAFSSDGRIAAFDLEVLAEPRNVIPPYDALLLLSRRAASEPAVVEALRPLLGAIDVTAMRRASGMVDRDREAATVSEAAAWLRRYAFEPGRGKN